MLSGNPLDPRTVPAWIRQTALNADTGIDAQLALLGSSYRINGRVYERSKAPRAEETSDKTLFPLVAFKRVGSTQMHNYGEAPILGDGDYLITFVMWFPSLPNGVSLTNYVSIGQIAVQKCFAGVLTSGVSYGQVHGCELAQEFGPVESGPERLTVAEAGYIARIRAGAVV